jgi:hypothetical protein
MPRDSNWEREEIITRARSSWWTALAFAMLKMLPLQRVRFLFLHFVHPFYLTHTEKMSTVCHTLMAASEEEKTQKKGMVGIVVNIGKNRAPVLSRNPSRLSRMEDSSVNLQNRESKPKHILESVLLDEAHEQISSQRPCLNIPRQSSCHLCECDHSF